MAKKKTIETATNENINAVNVDTDIDVNTIIENMEKVDISLPSNDEKIAELENKIKETIQPVAVLKEKIEEATNSQNDFIESISKNSQNTENMEKLIDDEIKKAEMLKSEVEKIIKTTNNSIKSTNITNWWNGMGYDL